MMFFCKKWPGLTINSEILKNNRDFRTYKTRQGRGALCANSAVYTPANEQRSTQCNDEIGVFRKFSWYYGMWCILYMSCSQIIAAPITPVTLLEDISKHIEQVLQSHRTQLKSKPMIVQTAVKTYLLPHVDVKGMSRSVLGKEIWHKATIQEKIAFSQAFTNLVIRTYAVPLSKYQGETVQFHPIRGGAVGRFTQVESHIIRRAGPPIPLNYQLILKDNAWYIYDFHVDGVSLLESYRSQFMQALKHASLIELIQRLNQETAV